MHRQKGEHNNTEAVPVVAVWHSAPGWRPPQAELAPQAPRFVAVLNLDWLCRYDRGATVEQKQILRTGTCSPRLRANVLAQFDRCVTGNPIDRGAGNESAQPS